MADISHFCPRPECRAWFHESCLARKYTDDASSRQNSSRALQLLAVDPDLQGPHPLFQRFVATRQAPSGGKQFSSGLPLAVSVRALKPGQLELPDSLIMAAARPIVRQANSGEYSSHGNARDVVLARRLLYQQLEGGHDIVTELISRLDDTWYENIADYMHVWRTLGVHRILASPYVPYWDKVVERGEMEVRPVICPKCRGVI